MVRVYRVGTMTEDEEPWQGIRTQCTGCSFFFYPYTLQLISQYLSTMYNAVLLLFSFKVILTLVKLWVKNVFFILLSSKAN